MMPIIFLPHFDVICHRLLKWRSTTQNLFVKLWLLITLLIGLCLSKTVSTDPQTSKQHMFTKYEFHYLNVPRVGTFTAHDDFQCILECLKNPLCLSVNIEASRRPDEKLWCELLSSDIHRNAKDYTENKRFHHFSKLVWFPAIVF